MIMPGVHNSIHRTALRSADDAQRYGDGGKEGC